MEEDSKSGEGETRTPMVKKDSIQMAAALSRDLRENLLVYFRDQVFRIGDVAGRLDGVYYAVFNLGRF